jgi:CheY-like chemotaxis protein
MKILYVEDNDDNVYMLKNRLTRAGFGVIIATTVHRALQWPHPSSPI